MYGRMVCKGDTCIDTLRDEGGSRQIQNNGDKADPRKDRLIDGQSTAGYVCGSSLHRKAAPMCNRHGVDHSLELSQVVTNNLNLKRAFSCVGANHMVRWK